MHKTLCQERATQKGHKRPSRACGPLAWPRHAAPRDPTPAASSKSVQSQTGFRRAWSFHVPVIPNSQPEFTEKRKGLGQPWKDGPRGLQAHLPHRDQPKSSKKLGKKEGSWPGEEVLGPGPGQGGRAAWPASLGLPGHPWPVAPRVTSGQPQPAGCEGVYCSGSKQG